MLSRTRGCECSAMSRSRQTVNMSLICVHYLFVRMERRAGAYIIKSLKSGSYTVPHHHHSRRVIFRMLIKRETLVCV
jgi:hypothetical protein